MVNASQVKEILEASYHDLRHPLDDPADFWSVIGDNCQSRANYSGEEVELQVRVQDALDYGIEDAVDRYITDITELEQHEMRQALRCAQSRKVMRELQLD